MGREWLSRHDRGRLEYLWSGPGSYSSMQAVNMVDQAGWYVLEVHASNGCVVMDSVYVSEDVEVPQLGLSVGQLGCSTVKPIDPSVIVTPANEVGTAERSRMMRPVRSTTVCGQRHVGVCMGNLSYLQ